ncbi:MAG: NosD domain-containing protein [Candidatus Thorarchaeota archaeon]
MDRRGLTVLLVGVLAVSVFVQLEILGDMKSGGFYLVKQHETSYIEHEPFNITSDSDFETQAWPGNGSKSNPYLIENLNITTNSSACIWIMNTTSHFRIQNCLLKSPEYIYSGYQGIFPITLTNVSNGVIRNNRVIESDAAISGLWISSCDILDNQFNVTLQAITIYYSNFTSIINNTQQNDPIYNALSFYRCRNLTISDNKFGDIKATGIQAFACNNCSISGNVLLSPESDIFFSWSGVILGGISCTISENQIENFWQSGMEISGKANVVENNNISSCQSGILVLTNTSIFRNNTIFDCFTSIEVVKANDTEIYDNSILGDGRFDAGIVLQGGSNCDIYSNEISDVGYGIISQGITGFNISYNTVNGRYGFGFRWYGTQYPYLVPDGPCYDCDISNNVFNMGGLYPSIENYEDWNFTSIRFIDNTVSGRLIGFFANLNDFSIIGDDYGQLHLVNCDLGTIYGGDFHGISSDIYDPYYYPGEATAISLVGCSRIQLHDVVLHNNSIGVSYQFSSACIQLRGSVYYNTWSGIIMSHSDDIDIVDVYIRDNLKGISASWSFDCQVRDSLIWENDEGINLVNCINCTLLNNDIFENGYAIFFGDSDGCDIRGNSVYHNLRGILFNSSSDCLLTQNQIYNNTGVGIQLDATSNRNEIIDNVFGYNSPNALCEGSMNSWDNGVDTGNWWSDYTGDGSYIIDENDQDNYPIVNSTTPVEPGPWEFDPLALAGVGAVTAVVVFVLIILYRRRVVIVD